MSYARSIEPQLLSIEAIIQKSEFKSKILNNIPMDLKRLFIEQASKGNNKIKQPRRVPAMFEGLYSHTIDHADNHHRVKKNVPPLPARAIKSQSLNASTAANARAQTRGEDGHAQRNVHTTRTNSYSRQGERRKIGQRRSMAEDAINIDRPTVPIFNNQNQNTTNVKQSETAVAIQDEKTQTEQENKVKKINRFEYELVLPQKDKKERGFRKVYISKQKVESKNSGSQNNISKNIEANSRNKTEQIQEELETGSLEHKMSHDALHQGRNRLGGEKEKEGNPLINRRKAQTQAIPDYVLAAIGQQTKKISPSKLPVPQAPQYLQLTLEPPTNDPKPRILKPPTSITNMKKKISYNKIRRSQQSSQDAMEPKVNFMRLVEKDNSVALARKNSEVLSREQRRLRSKERVPSFQRVGRARRAVEEEVRGWDIVEMPQFYDQY